MEVEPARPGEALVGCHCQPQVWPRHPPAGGPGLGVPQHREGDDAAAGADLTRRRRGTSGRGGDRWRGRCWRPGRRGRGASSRRVTHPGRRSSSSTCPCRRCGRLGRGDERARATRCAGARRARRRRHRSPRGLGVRRGPDRRRCPPVRTTPSRTSEKRRSPDWLPGSSRPGIWPSAMLAAGTRSSSSNIRPGASWPSSTSPATTSSECRRPRRLEPERGHRTLRDVRRAGGRGALVDRRARPSGRTGRADRPPPRAGPGAPRQVLAPIAPGLVREVGVASVEVLRAGDRQPITGRRVVGRRRRTGDRASRTPAILTLSLDGPWALDVAKAMALAASRGLLTRG